MKQLILTISMLLFLFSASNLHSQQAGVRHQDNVTNKSEGASVNTLPVSQLGLEVLQSSPVIYDRNTLISYSIPSEMDVEIILFDEKGTELRTLYTGIQSAGSHKINFAELKDGIYFYELKIGSYSEIKKIILVN